METVNDKRRAWWTPERRAAFRAIKRKPRNHCQHCGAELGRGKKYPYCRKPECIRAEKYRYTKCHKCGNEFWKRNYSENDNSKREFCSRECAGIGVRVECKCRKCGKAFTRIQSGAKRAWTYCSRECMEQPRLCACGNPVSRIKKPDGYNYGRTCGNPGCSIPRKPAREPNQDRELFGEWYDRLTSEINQLSIMASCDSWGKRCESAIVSLRNRHAPRAQIERTNRCFTWDEAQVIALERATLRFERCARSSWDRKIENLVGNLRKRKYRKDEQKHRRSSALSTT